MGNGKGIQAAVRGRLRDRRIPGQYLYQHGMHEDRQRVVPGGDVRDQSQWFALPEHGLNIVDIPLDPTDAAVDVRQGLGVRLADLPDQKQSN